MRNQLWFLIVIIALGLLLSIHSQAKIQSSVQSEIKATAANQIIELNKYLGGAEGKLNNKPALNFKFTNASGSPENTCSIITTDNYLRHSKNRLENINLSESNFYFDCQWNGTYYFLSNRYRTYAEVIIKQPDSQFPMSMHIEAKLVSLTGERVEIISGDISLRRKPR
ncbi:hypothetical protein [Shewanella fidelis]|uniref:Uncharacterized protein n=1 Tax=Shewanella fidelis TaxID=173509 RepID=A0AAW8NIQ7_9GAMM|nr:hypothetical protein [Shewanella fidelis]MDR8522541.1 hypothetical protein [Shewanella fidelis]MDW4812925.1 hypothetical protein [Shewanella fidelis]MDW4816816.1 hypothetical protein [Shewanella fidelis]MDW4820932.1 hypothetical protein [Shewanella fidelis]MDW4825533.1 hypothetical protein [Shewanella fidelis]